MFETGFPSPSTIIPESDPPGTVGAGVAVLVAVGECVAVALWVGVLDGVAVEVFVAVAVGVEVLDGVTVGVFVAVAV